MCQNMDLASSSCTPAMNSSQQYHALGSQQSPGRTVDHQTADNHAPVLTLYNQSPSANCQASTKASDHEKNHIDTKAQPLSQESRDQSKNIKLGQQEKLHAQKKQNQELNSQLQKNNLQESQKLDQNEQIVVINNNKNILVGSKSQNENTANKLLAEGFRVFRAGEIIPNPKKNICYKAIQLIGTGTFGQVLSVMTHSMNPKMPSPHYTMAMKVIKNKPAYINQGLIEIKNLRQIAKYQQKLEAMISQDCQGQQNKGQRNYLRLFDGFMWEGYLCIVMELMDNSILNILQSSEYKGLEMKWIQKWTKSLLLSLAKMHKIGIFHCDIKPENIMFRPEQPQNPVLIDFSSSCSKNSQLFTYIQSRFYRSPQVLLGSKPYSQKIDMWSLGCVLAEMYLGLPLLPGGSGYDQLKKIWKILAISNQNRPSQEQCEQINHIASMIQNSELGLKYFEVTHDETEQKIECNQEKQPSFSRKRFKDQQQSLDKSIKVKINLKIHKQYQKQYMEKAQINQQYFNLDNLSDMILVRNPPAKDIQTHELFIDLIKRILVFNPENRISAEEAFLHPFVGGTFRELESLRNLEEILESETEQKRQ